MIIIKYINFASVENVKILNDQGIGYIEKLEESIKQCVDKGIYLINMSFGTTQFYEKPYIRKIVNHFVNQGIIIIAASSNDGFITYPASLSNVISVACGDDFCINESIQRQKGIDFLAPSNHEITIEGATFRLGRSNSYAAPYVTAKVGNLISKKGMMTIDEIRRTLSKQETVFLYSPDWIEKAWISPEYKRKDADFYFDVDERDLQQCLDDIDTLVLCTGGELKRYSNLEKHIVYLGNDGMRLSGNKHRFWNIEMRYEQIKSSKKKAEKIDIPVVCCSFSCETDIIYYLYELKKLFADDGYNAFIGSTFADSFLYDLEYFPYELELEEKLENYIYWQTYYQQSDIVIIGTTEGDEIHFFETKADMLLNIKCLDDSLRVEISIEGNISVGNTYSINSKDVINKIYNCIVSSFDKKEDE